MQPVLEMIGISKRFIGVQALKNVDLKLYPGEIHSLIGQNGAGKSTLMKILSGNYKQDEGKILIHGKEVVINSISEAAKLGIGIVYQELSLLNNLTVVENIFLGRELIKRGKLDNAEMLLQAKNYLARLGIENIDVEQKVSVFPLAKKQLIEIAKVLSMEPSILILDEPTAALTNEDTKHLFDILFKLKEQGIALVFISHRLGEIKKYCDRGTILMNGSVTANVMMKDVTEDQLIEKMLGNVYTRLSHAEEKHHVIRDTPILEGQKICLKNMLQDVSFKIYPGEITGFTGLLGAGQDVLWRIIYGDIQATSGQVLLNGKKVKIKSPDHAVQMGIGLLTENRKEEGIFDQLSVIDNIAIPSLKSYKAIPHLPLINMRKVKKDSEKITDSINIVMRSITTPIKYLSGGNQQKTILSRWLLKDLDILIFLEPTRGVDVGAKAEIYKILEDLATNGKTIIVVSTDTTEILRISDRIFVMKDGQINGILDSDRKEEDLLKLVQGKEGGAA